MTKRVKDLISELELLNPNESIFCLYYTKDDVKKLAISAKFIGLDLLKKEKPVAYDNINEKEINKLIQERLESRLKGDYEKADKIREKLLSMNIHIKDLEGTTVWDYNPD